MVHKKKTWQEAQRQAKPSKILQLEKSFPCYNAVHMMGAEKRDTVVLANPSEVVELMKKST